MLEKYKQLKTANKDGEQIWKEKPIIVDETIGTQKLIIPGLTPFAAMHFLAVRSFGGSEFPSSFYTFYEGEDAFHFKNIENYTSNYLQDFDINSIYKKKYILKNQKAILKNILENKKLKSRLNIKHIGKLKESYCTSKE